MKRGRSTGTTSTNSHNPPELPAIWGTTDVAARYRDNQAVVEALKANVGEPSVAAGLELRMPFSHWYTWGTMVYARFEILERRHLRTRWRGTTRSGAQECGAFSPRAG